MVPTSGSRICRWATAPRWTSFAGSSDRSSTARIVVITGFNSTLSAVEALADGAVGYVLKAQSTGDLLAAIRTVANGHSYVAPEIAAKLPHTAPGGRFAARQG